MKTGKRCANSKGDRYPFDLISINIVKDNRIIHWVLHYISNKLNVRQYGCLKGKSTTHELVDLLLHWHQALDRNQTIRAVFFK